MSPCGVLKNMVSCVFSTPIQSNPFQSNPNVPYTSHRGPAWWWVHLCLIKNTHQQTKRWCLSPPAAYLLQIWFWANPSRSLVTRMGFSTSLSSTMLARMKWLSMISWRSLRLLVLYKVSKVVFRSSLKRLTTRLLIYKWLKKQELVCICC